MTSENTAPGRPTLAALAERIDDADKALAGHAGHIDEQYHALIRRNGELVAKLDAVLARQAELLEMIKPYVPLLERIAHLADGPAGKIAGGPLAALLTRHAKTKGTPPDG